MHRPAVAEDPVGMRAQPMRLAPVTRTARPSAASVGTAPYSSGGREANDPVEQKSRGAAPAEHSAATPVSATASEEPKAPKAEKPEPAKPEHPVVPAPEEHAAPPAAAHREPPATPASGQKEKAPDEPKPDEAGDGTKK